MAGTEGERRAAWGQGHRNADAQPEIDAKDKSARLGDFLQVRHQGASTIYFWIATLSLSLSSARSCKDSTMSSLDRVVITNLFDPRDRLPGIGKTVQEEHKGPLFPNLAGGCVSLQGNEVIVASPNAPSCSRSPKLGDWEPVPSLSLIGTINYQDVWSCSNVWSRPSSAWGGLCFAERKWFKPDIALFVFPVKTRDHFPLIFFFFKGSGRYF